MDDITITTKGIVVPADWDEDGNVVAVAISSYEEIEYLVDNQNGIGKALINAIRCEVKVSGIINETNKSRRKMITVNDYLIKTMD